jgi:hypothetical protein
MITFKAYFGGARICKDGEVKITLVVSAMEAPQALALSVKTDTTFDVTVEPEKNSSLNSVA